MLLPLQGLLPTIPGASQPLNSASDRDLCIRTHTCAPENSVWDV